MQHSVEHQLSEQEQHLIATSQLGAPLSLYEIRRVYLYLMRGVGLFVLGFSIVVPLLVFMVLLWGRNKGYLVMYVMDICTSGVGIWIAWYLLRVEVPALQKRHIVVCEHGLLQIGKLRWFKPVDLVVRWENVLDIKQPLFGPYSYAIIRREGEAFDIESIYQDLEELVEMIKLQIGSGEDCDHEDFSC